MARSLASLAHGLAIAPSYAEALRSIAEVVADADRRAHLVMISVDERRAMLAESVRPTATGVERTVLDTTLEHFPPKERTAIISGGQFVDFGDRSDEYARLLRLPSLGEAGFLAIRGINHDASLRGMIALYEPRKLFGLRAMERVAPAVALFELAYLRLLERDARTEAVNTLEDLTRRVHLEYERQLVALEARLREAAGPRAEPGDRLAVLELEGKLATATEAARRATRRAEAVEATVSTAVSELEKAHIELHRRSEQLRRRSRTLYLLDRVLTLDRDCDDPRKLADGLLALIGDDMQAHRCSLMLCAPGETALYIAAARGLDPTIGEGTRVAIGSGVAGKVAATREPLLVQDVEYAKEHPLLKDEFFTTGSFMSFPLVYGGKLVGVVNLANRAQRAAFVEDDLDRVRLLASVVALIATNSKLCERLPSAFPIHR